MSKLWKNRSPKIVIAINISSDEHITFKSQSACGKFFGKRGSSIYLAINDSRYKNILTNDLGEWKLEYPIWYYQQQTLLIISVPIISSKNRRDQTPFPKQTPGEVEWGEGQGGIAAGGSVDG